MTDVSNRDRLASDERFDTRFSGDRKEPVEGDVRTDHDHAAEAPRNFALISAGEDVIDSRLVLSGGFNWARRRWFCGRSICATPMFARRKGIMFSGPHGELSVHPRSHSRSGNSA
jgi:hypothetical protein